jgi:transcriptional regulator with XRE-family HTH domain
MHYGKAIRIVRTAYGLSKAELADRLSIGASHLSLIEAEKRKPSLDVLDEISTVLHIPPHLLTLLASDPGNLKDPKNAEQIANFAGALLNLLVSAGEQGTLPISKSAKRKRKKIA